MEYLCMSVSDPDLDLYGIIIITFKKYTYGLYSGVLKLSGQPVAFPGSFEPGKRYKLIVEEQKETNP
jgi:hypothetical protein